MKATKRGGFKELSVERKFELEKLSFPRREDYYPCLNKKSLTYTPDSRTFRQFLHCLQHLLQHYNL